MWALFTRHTVAALFPCTVLLNLPVHAYAYLCQKCTQCVQVYNRYMYRHCLVMVIALTSNNQGQHHGGLCRYMHPITSLYLQTADVKRVWGMRQAFLLLDFEDNSAEPFKAMLLSATLQPLYINTEEVGWADYSACSLVPRLSHFYSITMLKRMQQMTKRYVKAGANPFLFASSKFMFKYYMYLNF